MLSNQELKELLLGDQPIVRNIDLSLVDIGRISPIQPASIDLHVGEILVPPQHRNADGQETSSHAHAQADRYTVPSGGSVVLLTREVISFPADIAGLMFPKSSGLAERGVLLTNFGHVDPGYKGRLRYALVNMSSADLEIRTGDPVACLCIFALHEPAYPDFSQLRGENLDDERRTRDFARYLSPELLSLGRISNEAKRVAKDLIVEQGFLALLISNVVAVVVGVSAAAVAVAVSWFLFIEPRMEKVEMKTDQLAGSIAGLPKPNPEIIH